MRFAASLADDVRRTARELSTTQFAVLLAAYCLLLCRSGNTTDLMVGVPTAVRPDPRSAEVFGYSVNTLPVPVQVPRTAESTSSSDRSRRRCGACWSFARIRWR